MSEPDPKPVFATKEAIVDGRAAVTVVNQALRDYSAKGYFPWHLVLRILIDSEVTESDETEILDRFEDELIALAGVDCELQYVGRTTTNGIREAHLYLESPEAAHDALTAAIERGTVRELEYELAYDVEWALVEHFYDDV